MMKNNYIKQKRKDQNPVNHWKIFEGQLVFLLRSEERRVGKECEQ